MKTPHYNLRASAKWRKKQQESGFCRRCLVKRLARGKNYCRACMRYDAYYKKQAYHQRRARGVCVTCGRNPAGRWVSCTSCRRRRSQWREERIAK